MLEQIEAVIVKGELGRQLQGASEANLALIDGDNKTIYCVVNKNENSIGGYQEFHDDVVQAETLAIADPEKAPFSIEKREKIWFSNRSIR